MNIAYVTDHVLPRTSTDTEQLVTMSAAFADVGCEVTLVTPSHWFKTDNSVKEIADFYNVSPSFKLYTIKGAVPFIRGIEKIVHAMCSALHINRMSDADIVYTRNLPVVIAFLLFSAKKIVFENYRPWPDQNAFMTLLFRWFKQSAQVKGLVLHSALAAKSYRRIGFQEQRLLVAHNGVDPDQFENVESQEEARKQLGWDPQQLVVTYTGRVNKDKGLDMMLTLARQYEHVRFVIVGSEREGTIEQEAATLNNVTVYRWQSIEDIPAFLIASDILFIPPTAKPLKEIGNTVLPMKTFIYLAAGRAILAPRTPDLEEVLTHNQNALLVSPDDQLALREAVDQLIEDDLFRRKLGEQARKDSKKYNWKKRAQKIVDFIS